MLNRAKSIRDPDWFGFVSFSDNDDVDDDEADDEALIGVVCSFAFLAANFAAARFETFDNEMLLLMTSRFKTSRRLSFRNVFARSMFFVLDNNLFNLKRERRK